MRIAWCILAGLLYFGATLLLDGWGLPSPERAAYYPADASVRYARAGAGGFYVTGPSKSFHPDEASILGALAAMRPARGDLNPHFFNYPSLHIYAVGAALWVAQRAHWIPASRDAAHYLREPADAARLYRVGRAVSGLWAGATVAALCLASGAGAAAALMLGLVPLFLVCATSLTVDMAATFLCTAAALAAARIRKPARTPVFWAGVLAGLATSAKYPAALCLLPLLLVCLGPGETRRDRAGLVIAALAGALLGFLAGTPYALLAPGEFLSGVRAELAHGGEAHGYQFMDAGPAWAFHLRHTLLSGCGLPFTLFLAGLPLALLGADSRRRALLLFVAASAALLWVSHLRFARYALPALPVAALLAAEGWGLLLGKLKGKLAPAGEFLSRAGLAALASGQAVIALAYALVMLGDDTRMIAAKYVAAWPAGVRVRLLEPPYFTTPPLDAGRQEFTVGPVEADTLILHSPQYVIASEFELRDLARLRARYPELARTARALMSVGDTLRAGRFAWVATQVRRPASLGAYERATRDEPQELLMLHPTIFLWKRIS